jgi:hypothetical protein
LLRLEAVKRSNKEAVKEEGKATQEGGLQSRGEVEGRAFQEGSPV